MSLRKRVYEVLEVANPNDNLSKAFDMFIVTLIGLNVIALILESVKNIQALSPKLFGKFEYVSVMLFSVEYIARIWSCVEKTKFKKPISGRLRFSITPLALVDLLAIPKEHCYGLFREGKAPDECFSVSWPPENDWTGIWGREDI